ncbi:MAG: dihydrodipicolinate reductase [Candidatus Lokiarchaeota archaeon]|nr:dihydrodipicolinate reductase [Candidatus Lokiarchaeota archaeon]
MANQFNVIQVGLGPMGRLIAKLILNRENLSLKGVVDIDPNLKGKNLGKTLEIEKGSNIIIETDLSSILLRKEIDVIIIATSSSLEKITPLIKQAVDSGINIISICEELSYPFVYQPELSEELDLLAKAKNVTIVGTGINPGYLMDLLPLVITAPCQSVKSIKVTRMMNSAKRRVSFQRKIGTGLSPNEFRQKIYSKEITGHVGLTQSIQMICDALGFEYDEIKEFPPKEIITEKNFSTSYGEKVLKGNVCGLQSKAVAIKDDNELVLLNFVAYAGEHEEYDSIEIEGTPNIHQKIVGGVHGDLGTSAMVANLIPIVTKARSGLLTMKDLPVPCNTENIWKE